MSAQLFKRLSAFRKKHKLSIAEISEQLGAHFTTYHRWKKSNKIIGPYKKIIRDFLSKHEGLPVIQVSKPSSSKSPQHSNSDIAVIGVSCYYPGASNVKELWENILSRRIQFRRMLDQRLPLSEYYDADPKAPEKTYLTKAAFIENFQFDWGRLRIPKKTVESTDIAHWLALDTALRTFEDAGYKLSEIPIQNTSVIVGNTLTGEQTRSQTLRLRWPYVQKVLDATLGNAGISLDERSRLASDMEKIYKSAFYPITEDSLSGGLANTIAGRICNYLNLKGGGYIVDGACSSSLLAVATAADALKMGNVNLALAGGVDISLDPFELVGFAKAGALAKDEMRVYDQRANGFLPGEGCGFVLLKRMEDAIKDKNYIYAVIKGWGISSDGKGGIMEPSSSGQAFAIGRAYKNLDYKIADVDFVEGHGTGTTKGDRVELEGIASAIEQSITKNKKNTHICGVTSFKSIVGHTKAAAGVGGLIKAILAVNQRVLPPTASCTDPNEVFQDKAKYLYPIIQGGVFPQNKMVRAGISSAGFGGINCHVTVESKDAPKQELKSKIDEHALFVSQQQTEVFVFASRSISLLKKVIQRFKEDLRNISIAEMADLAALLNKKVKNTLPIKAVIVADSPERLYEALVLIEQEINIAQLGQGQIHRIKTKDFNTHILLSNAAQKARIGFLYPGQGSQRLNMTRVLTERFKWARDLLSLSKLPLYERIYKSTDKFLTKDEQQEFERQLADTRITQPAVVSSSLIWTEFLSKLDIEPQCVGGHSLGELVAFYKAGAFDKKTLIKFAELRGSLMAAHGRHSGGMVSLFCSKQKAGELVDKISGNLVIANINSPTQIIVSGGKNEIEKIIELAKREDISIYRLNASNAFHSSLMNPASEKIHSSKILQGTFKPNNVRVYSGISANVIEDRVSLNEYFSEQVISPVNFVDLVESLSKECDVLVEVGPGRILTDLVKAINKGEGSLCLPVESTSQNDRDLNVVLAELFIRNVPIKWEELYKNRSIKVFVPASRKKFIENQCEHPLMIGNQIIKGEPLGLALRIAETEQIEDAVHSEPVKGKDKIADLLIDLTHKITGFEKESISLNSKLLDGLNLDSIKAGELIGQAARALGIAGQIDPSQVSNLTLGQIRDRLHDLAESYGKTGIGQETAADILKRYHDKSWVRNFIVNLIPQEIMSHNVNQLNGFKNVVLLSEEGEAALADTMKDGFRNKKTKICKINYEDIDDKNRDLSFDCLIAILPKGKEYADLDRDSLKKTIRRFNKIVGLAHSNQIKRDAFIVFVQFGGGNFGENSSLKDIVSSSAKSLASTLYLERPDLKVRIIDFDRQTSEREISSKVLDELQTYERFNAVGYDGKLKRKVVSYDNSLPAEYKKRDIEWSHRDVVLVTGGAKGITAQCALEFARATKAKMILMGRSSLPDKKDESNEIVQTLKQFEKEHLRANYYQCDVSDETNVLNVVKEIEKNEGGITGFIHGAGLNSLKRLKQVSVTEALNESLPKVMGAVNVCKALSKEPPKLIVAITSIIGITGMEGSGWYGLANEILNLHLYQFKTQHPQTQVAAIAYSVWDEVGMGAKLGSVERLAHKGIGAIPVEQGVKRFRQLVESDPGTQQVIVAARIAGIDTWRSPFLKANPFRFIEKIEYVLPGVELIAKAQLNIKDDSYLLDHNWKGSLLFPFVFGFEAMSQAVAFLLGLDKLEQITAKDINLQRPISVPPETGTSIEIHAQVLEPGKRNDPQQVKVEIYSQETGYREPHFSAVFEIDQTPRVIKRGDQLPRTENKTDIEQADIYGPILFQGKLFQCIEQIHELYYDENIKKGECVFTAAYKKSTEVFLSENKKFGDRFLIGDPFFIDSILQSMQLIIPQDISLPKDIQSIEFIPIKEKSNGKFVSRSRIKQIDIDHYRGDAEVIGNGFLLKVNNCGLKVLDTIVDNPTANDLLAPTSRDRMVLDDCIGKYSRELGVQFPHLTLTHIPEIKDMGRDDRHRVELPFIEKAVKDFLKRNNQVVKNIDVRWYKNGKPYLADSSNINIHISLTHEDGLVICALGTEGQAIDLQTIVSKTKEQWRELLGNKKFEVIKNFTGENLNYAATAIWASGEVCIKAEQKNLQYDLQIERFSDRNFYILRNNQDLLINIVIKFSRGSERLLTFLIKNYKSFQEPSVNEQLGFGEKYFHFYADYSGPQAQLVTVKKFPVTFKHNKMKSRRVHFCSYFDWMGEVREYALLPILKQLADILETKEWGVATNNVKLDILGELRGGDIVEARMWLDKKINDNVYDLRFEFRKIEDGNTVERVATAIQRISWVKILGYGKARVNRLPFFLEDIMQKMEPRAGAPSISQAPINELYKNLHFEFENLLEDFGSKDLFLSEMKIQTTLAESNLVGNIYFANYSIWIERATDFFLYNLWPEAYTNDRINDELVCVQCNIDHLNEAMPFDLINIRVYLHKVYANGIILKYEIYANNDKKLAVAKQSLLWLARNKSLEPSIGNIPDILINKFIQRKSHV